MYDANCKPGDKKDFGGHMYSLRPDRIWESCEEFYVNEEEFYTSILSGCAFTFIDNGNTVYPKYILEMDSPYVKDAITFGLLREKCGGRTLVTNDRHYLVPEKGNTEYDDF